MDKLKVIYLEQDYSLEHKPILWKTGYLISTQEVTREMVPEIHGVIINSKTNMFTTVHILDIKYEDWNERDYPKEMGEIR